MAELRIGIDTGGTFTDVVLLPPGGGSLLVHKLLSTPDDPARAVLDGITAVLGLQGAAGAPAIIHGSTVATNALLEGKGGRAALLTTDGFPDLLWLRRQNRPDLYDLEPQVPQPPVAREDCWGVAERLDPAGTVIQGLDRREIERMIEGLRMPRDPRDLPGLTTACRGGEDALPPTASRDLTAVAICLLHSYANPAHEQALAAALRQSFPGLHITVSSDLLPEFREYERASTCFVNALCAAPMLGYLGRLEAGLCVSGGTHQSPNPSLRIMGSAGGSLPLAAVRKVPARTVLSGPAGGLIGAQAAAQAAGCPRFLSYDMGGTSTDVALSTGAPALTQRTEIAGLPLKLPALDIHTVGAGGGSLAWLDAGGALRVGPASLGADPGPACYGRQSAPYRAAVTDAHAVLGHIPAGTKLAGALEVDALAARAALAALAAPLGLSIEAAAHGVLRVAAAEVARALRRMSVERGHDPRDFALLPFGGMGGLHAVELAEQLGMTRILLPRHPGLLSALGMLSAAPVYHFAQTVLLPVGADACVQLLGAAASGLWRKAGLAAPLLERATAALAADGIAPAARQFTFSADLRYAGQSHEINVPLAGAAELFEAEHQRLYGYRPAGTMVELVALRLEARGPAPVVDSPPLAPRSRQRAPASPAATPIWAAGGWQDWPVLERATLLAGDELAGPVLLTEYSATTLIPPGWTGQVQASGSVLLEQRGSAGEAAGVVGVEPALPDAVTLSIFRHLYAAIAEEMGARLMRSAYSPNIKERRDFSCALLDGSGQLLAQAAHIPVHLGSMPLSVHAVLAAFPASTLRPGDVFVVNDPFHGGTHLPDITVVAPVFLPGEASPRFFAANRAHHADIGGISPGSMPLSRSIDEEGLRILPQRLDSACLDWICAASRTPQERRGDLLAQLAALELGRMRLLELAERYGAEACTAYGAALLDYSERCMLQTLSNAAAAAGGPATAAFTDYLDGDGLGGRDIALRCKLTLTPDEAVVDLRECDPQVEGPFNAVHAICVSAALYVFRCLAQRLLPGTDIPENAGLLRRIRVLTTPGTVADALPPAAVAGGNVETSQRLVDVILGTLAQLLPALLPAASGGSMNNITVGSTTPGVDAITPKEQSEVRSPKSESTAGDCEEGVGLDPASEVGPRTADPSHGSGSLSNPAPAGGTPFAYYETLACGAGGGPQRPGASAVHTHMTNTLNTPVEALEHAYPLRIVRYALRRGSGGAGSHRGGDGIVRRYRALAPCTVTLLTERRRHAPWGLCGGRDGQPGANTLYRTDGSETDLGGKATVELKPGDELEIATPGGGGWG